MSSATQAQEKLPKVFLTGIFSEWYSDGHITLQDTTGQEIASYPIQAKHRGGTAKYRQKKSFSVRLLDDDGKDADASFFGMRTDNFWILDGMPSDPSRMRNRVAMDLWRDMDARPYYADAEPKARLYPMGRYVELYLNGSYNGLYILSERIDRKQLKLKKESQGTIRGLLYKGINYNGTGFYIHSSGYDNRSSVYQGFECHYPIVQDLGYTDWQPLAWKQDFIQDSSDEDFLCHYAEEFDAPMLQDIFILINVVAAIDNTGKNTFFSIHDLTADRRMSFVPWDLDCSFGRTYDGSSHPEARTSICFYSYLIERITALDVAFRQTLAERYFAYRHGVLSADQIKAHFARYFQLFQHTGAGDREAALWSGTDKITLQFAQEQTFINNFIDRRLAFLDTYFQTMLRNAETNVQTPHTSPTGTDTRYDLSGTTVRHPQKGHLYIQNGKTILIP